MGAAMNAVETCDQRPRDISNNVAETEPVWRTEHAVVFVLGHVQPYIKTGYCPTSNLIDSSGD